MTSFTVPCEPSPVVRLNTPSLTDTCPLSPATVSSRHRQIHQDIAFQPSGAATMTSRSFPSRLASRKITRQSTRLPQQGHTSKVVWQRRTRSAQRRRLETEVYQGVSISLGGVLEVDTLGCQLFVDVLLSPGLCIVTLLHVSLQVFRSTLIGAVQAETAGSGQGR